MWYIKEESRDHGPKYWLGGINTDGRTIGRKVVDIRLRASSVSRVHAKINVSPSSFYTPIRHKQSTVVSVIDSSAYGTFLKYPPGHVASRDEPPGHHRRLSKEEPTDVYEGALLAFGAPTAWWQVCWYPVVAIYSRLTSQQEERMFSISTSSSLQLTERMSDGVTHVITSVCVSNSRKFLGVLSNNGHIVMPAWCEAALSITTNACKAIATSETDEVATAVTNLPPESKYVPPFCAKDHELYPPAVLENAFNPQQREKRTSMFNQIVFAFSRKDRSVWWGPILDLLGATAVLTQALPERSELSNRRILYVLDDRESTSSSSTGLHVVEEKYMVESILCASLEPIERALRLMSSDTSVEPDPSKRTVGGTLVSESRRAQLPGNADNTDVATPGPFDVDSDVESEESNSSHVHGKVEIRDQDPLEAKSATADEITTSGARAKKRKLEITTAQPSKGGQVQTGTDNESVKKRTRSSSDNDLQPTPDPVKKAEASALQNSAGMKGEDTPCRIDATEYNPRRFFSVPLEDTSPPRETESVASCEDDVRPFRIRKLPSATEIPLKRVKASTETKIYRTMSRKLPVVRDLEVVDLEKTRVERAEK